MLSRYPLLRCLAIYRYMPWKFTLTALLFIAVNIGLAWQQWLIGQAINDVSNGQAVVQRADGTLDSGTAWFWVWFIVFVATLRGVLHYIAGVLSLTTSQQLLTLLRERILVQVQKLHLGYHWEHGMGEMITRTTRDADKVRDALVSFWRQVVETPLVMIAAVGLLCWYHPLLGVVPLALTILGLWIFVLQTGHLVVLDRAVGAAYDHVNQDLSEGISGVRVIKSFALEDARIARFDKQIAFFVEQARIALAYASSRIPLPQAVVAMGHVWILVYGAYLVQAAEIGLGELVASLLIATTLVFRIEGVGRVMQVFADARSSADRIWQLLDAKSEIVTGTVSLPEGPLGIRLMDVSVAAPDGGRFILERCSLEVKPAQIVALVGATGVGKSLLASLLPRLSDVTQGGVFIGSEQAGWKNVQHLDLAQLRRRVHVVPQESFLFSDTLAANLRKAAPEATDEQLLWALRMASAEEVLERLPHGLDTALGDRGVTLSGGQRQRLNLARALLARPDIICLDDATSALDTLSERRVLDNLRRLKTRHGQPPAVLVISSRLSTILLADYVLLLDAGKIVEQGTHQELSERNAHYCDLLGIEHE